MRGSGSASSGRSSGSTVGSIRVRMILSGTGLLTARAPSRSALGGGSGIRSPPPPPPPPGPGSAMKISRASCGRLESVSSEAVVRLTVVSSATNRITPICRVVDASAESPCDCRSPMSRLRRAPPRTPGRAPHEWTANRPLRRPRTARSASSCDTSSPSTVGMSALAISCLTTQVLTPPAAASSLAEYTSGNRFGWGVRERSVRAGICVPDTRLGRLIAKVLPFGPGPGALCSPKRAW